jgi:hypothetical protein
MGLCCAVGIVWVVVAVEGALELVPLVCVAVETFPYVVVSVYDVCTSIFG